MTTNHTPTTNFGRADSPTWEELEGAVARRNDALTARVAELEAALATMERCPGVDQTDQETGDTFRELIRAALAKG